MSDQLPSFTPQEILRNLAAGGALKVANAQRTIIPSSPLRLSDEPNLDDPADDFFQPYSGSDSNIVLPFSDVPFPFDEDEPNVAPATPTPATPTSVTPVYSLAESRSPSTYEAGFFWHARNYVIHPVTHIRSLLQDALPRADGEPHEYAVQDTFQEAETACEAYGSISMRQSVEEEEKHVIPHELVRIVFAARKNQFADLLPHKCIWRPHPRINPAFFNVMFRSLAAFGFTHLRCSGTFVKRPVYLRALLNGLHGGGFVYVVLNSSRLVDLPVILPTNVILELVAYLNLEDVPAKFTVDRKDVPPRHISNEPKPRISWLQSEVVWLKAKKNLFAILDGLEVPQNDQIVTWEPSLPNDDNDNNSPAQIALAEAKRESQAKKVIVAYREYFATMHNMADNMGKMPANVQANIQKVFDLIDHPQRRTRLSRANQMNLFQFFATNFTTKYRFLFALTHVNYLLHLEALIFAFL